MTSQSSDGSFGTDMESSPIAIENIRSHSAVAPLIFRSIGEEDTTRRLEQYAAAEIAEEHTRFQEKANAIADEAFARGCRETRVEMEEALRAEMAGQIEEGRTRASSAIVQIAQERVRYFQRIEREVVRLALAIAGRILHREAQMDALLLRGAVHAALEQLAEKNSLVLYVATEDVPLWKAHFEVYDDRLAIEIVPGRDMHSLDCVLETTAGNVDLGVRTQLEEIERGFFDLLGHKPADMLPAHGRLHAVQDEVA